MLTFFDRVTKSKEPHFLPDTLWPIVVAYAQDNMVDMMHFCASLGWRTSLHTLQEADRLEMQACAKQTKDLLAKTNQTTQIINTSKTKIAASITTIEQTHSRLLDQTLAEQRETAHRTFETNTSILTGNIAALQLQIEALQLQKAACQADIDAVLTQQHAQATTDAQATLQAALKKYDQGLAAREREVQFAAKLDLELAQRELANSSAYFQQVCRMIRNLEMFPQLIDAQIAKKRGWNNRFRMVTLAEFDELQFTSTALGRVCTVIYYEILGSLLVGVISFVISFVFTIFLLPVGTAWIGFIVALAIGVILGITLTTFELSTVLDHEKGPGRFEKHILSRSFSQDLVAKFSEIKTKIANFQVIDDAIKTPEVTHAVSQLEINTATVSSIRKAMEEELGFFQLAYTQLPKYQEQQLVNADFSEPQSELKIC